MRQLIVALVCLSCASSAAIAQSHPDPVCPVPERARGTFREVRYPGATETHPTGINDQGVIVGNYTEGGQQFPFVYENGHYATLVTSGLDSPGANAINNAGVIVGGTRTGAFMVKDGTTIPIAIPGAIAIIPLSINDHNEVAGFYLEPDGFDGREVGFVWRDGVVEEVRLPTVSSGTGVLSINNDGNLVLSDAFEKFLRIDGEVEPVSPCAGVGTMEITHAGYLRGTDFLYTGDRHLQFRHPRATITQLFDINESAHAVGVAYTLEGTVVGFRFVPAALTVSSPNTSSQWGLNTRQRIAWTYTGDAPQVQIEINRTGKGDAWELIAIVPNEPGHSQDYFWFTTGPATDHARLRVSALGDPIAADTNNADIRIAPAAIHVLRPRSRTPAQFGSAHRVFFSHNLGVRAPVAIEVSPDGGRSWRTVALTLTRGSTTSSFQWTVDLTQTIRAQVRVRALEGSGAVGVSELFTVVAASPGTVS